MYRGSWKNTIELFNEITSSKGTGIFKNGWLASKIKDAFDLGLEKFPSIDPFKELDLLIAESEDVVRSNTLRLTAIACLTENEREILRSKDDTDSDLSDDDECEWLAQESRGASDLFEDKLL